MQLRPYQLQTCDSVRSGWSEFSKQLVVLPTGGGKTIVAANISKEFVDHGERVLFLAHREELLTQTIDKFRRAVDLWADLEKAEYRASRHAQVVVGSVQTFLARGSRWPIDHFGLVIVDEAHHVPAESYQRVLRQFDGHAKVLGITATPDRADKKEMGAYFQNIAIEISLFELIKQGYLSRIHVKALPLKIDLAGVKSTAGDYDAKDLGEALGPYLSAVAASIGQHAAGRRVLAFLPLIATSQRFVKECTDAGLCAAHVDGNSPDRKEILSRFAAGEFQLLSNAMLLTEGFDDPGIDCIVNLRPTRSRPLYSQIVGRGTRIAPGKENLLLLDFLWQHERHNLIRPAHLVAASQELADEMTDLLESETGGQGELELEELAGEASRKREEKLRRELEEKAKRKAFEGDAIEFCLSVGALAAADWEDVVEWHSRPVSEGQARLLVGAGIAVETIKSRGHASAVIEVIQSRRTLGLATAKQVKFCKRLGHASAHTLTKEQASEFIDSRIGKRRKWEAAA